jgi:hypothetical protein
MESSPGKLTGGGPYPLLESLIQSEPGTWGISPEFCRKAEAALKRYGIGRVMPGNPTVQRVFTLMQTALVGCPDYALGTKDDFDALALQVIMFCKDRQDAGVKELRMRGAYLRDANATEFDLQTDLREWLSGNFLRGQILTEVEGVATGRADIYVSLGSHRFIIELKRSHEQVTHQHARSYMAQATAYQGTNVKLGMLGILEIVERSGPADALDECIWPDSFMTSATAIPRHLMVFKVPGRLATPHSFSPTTRKPRKSGGERRKANTIGVNDVIKVKTQRSFFPMFLDAGTKGGGKK